MSKIKKFRKNNWWDEEEDAVLEKRDLKKKKFDRALRTRDINYLIDDSDEFY